MPTVNLCEAENDFCNLVDQTLQGEVVTITLHGKPVAELVSIEATEAAKRAIGKDRPNFGENLMSFPGGIDFERST